jgi:CheY-like chemotaxis protein
VAQDAASAIDLACDRQPDIALVDVQMPARRRAAGGPQASEYLDLCQLLCQIAADGATSEAREVHAQLVAAFEWTAKAMTHYVKLRA